MADYKTMYTMLFNAVTDAINILQKVQEAAEEKYINDEETQITILRHPNESEST